MFESTPTYQGKTFFCTERTFWERFYKDLHSARKTVHIISPFIAVRRSGNLSKFFEELIGRGVEVIVYTRFVAEHGEHMRINAKFSIRVLKEMGVKFRFISKIHQKVAIIDDQICWSGSLNILSWNGTGEQMTRVDSIIVADEFMRELRL